MSQGVSKQTTKIIDKNNSMRNVIYETASNIEFLLKEYYESLYPKKNNDKANVCLNSSILDDLPFDQQVEIYKNSISEIRKESPETKANRIYIENLQKQIERLKSNIYNQNDAGGVGGGYKGGDSGTGTTRCFGGYSFNSGIKFYCTSGYNS